MMGCVCCANSSGFSLCRWKICACTLTWAQAPAVMVSGPAAGGVALGTCGVLEGQLCEC